MALPTRTYETVRKLAEAKLGGMTIDGNRKDRFDAIINAAARNAYDAYNYWPRFLVYAEPRTISRNYISFSEDSFYVYGAGTDAANGLYVRNGSSSDGNPAYTKYDTDGTTALYNIWSLSNIRWYLTDVAIDTATFTALYSVPSNATAPPLTGWVASTGIAPAPVLVDLADMGTVLDVNVGGDPFGYLWDNNKKYFVDSTGVRILNNVNGETVAYVTYKKELDVVYGDGTGGTTSDIPNEWSEYMARYAAQAISASELSGSELQGTVGFREVERAYDDMLWREESQNPEESIQRRVMTQLSTTNYLY
jgi:hypothetical protein